MRKKQPSKDRYGRTPLGHIWPLSGEAEVDILEVGTSSRDLTVEVGLPCVAASWPAATKVERLC
jgi:hypothetical protein